MADPASDTHGTPDAERMQCMEVWGGNRETNRAFEMPGLRTWVLSRPHQQADRGGDVYYVSSCASGRITRMLLADVSGHGSLASGLALGLRELMRKNVNMIQQQRFVRAMNEQFAELAQQGGFATAVVNTFFAPTRSLSLCNAGHPSPLVFRAAEQQWAPIVSPQAEHPAIVDMPFGILREMDYRQAEVKLAAGDLVLCFSDALIEARDGDGRLLGEAGVLRLVQGIRPPEPAGFIDRLIEAIADERPDNLDHDDVTVMLFEATGGGTRFVDNLLAPFRLLGGVADRTTIA